MIRASSTCLLILFCLFANGQPQTGKNLREYFEKTPDLDPIEGIWNIETTREFYHFDTLYDVKNFPDTEQVAITKSVNGFTAYYLRGDSFNLEFANTDVKGVYMYCNYFPLNSTFSKKQAVICTHGKMEFTYDLPEEYAIAYCGGSYRPNTRVVNTLRWRKVFPPKP